MLSATTENLTVMPAISYTVKLSLYVQKSRVNPLSFSQPYFDMKMGKMCSDLIRHKNIYVIVEYKKKQGFYQLESQCLVGTLSV